jgi:phosphatidylinositol alpha-1,6-mannosyltransferase
MGVRILCINPPGDIYNGVGGIQTYAREVQTAMRVRGHDVMGISFDPPAILGDLVLEDYIPRAFCFNRYYFWRVNYLSDYRYHNALCRLTRKAIREFHPDLLHVFHTYQYGALWAGNVPGIVTCHGLEIADIPPVRGSLERAAGIHCNSNFTKARVESFLGPQTKARVHTWGIRATTLPEIEPQYDLITVGRVVRRKNIDTILRVLALHPEWRYAVVGEGPGLPGLRELAKTLGLNNVEFFGKVSEDEKNRLLSLSRLFVMCPRNDNDSDVEGLGLVFFEAHGAGLPILSARSGGAPEAVGEAGILVNDPLDVAEIEQSLRAALDSATYARLRAAVIRRQKSHSWERFIAGLDSWYMEVLEQGSVSSTRHAMRNSE